MGRFPEKAKVDRDRKAIDNIPVFDQQSVLKTVEVGGLEGDLLACRSNAAEPAGMRCLPAGEGDDAISLDQHLVHVVTQVRHAFMEAPGEGFVTVAAQADETVVAAIVRMEVVVD